MSIRQQAEAMSGKYLGALQHLQLVMLIDRSGSMRKPDHDSSGEGRVAGTSFTTPKTGRPYWSRWDNMVCLMKWLCAEGFFSYDADGSLPVLLFGNDVIEFEAKTPSQLTVNLCRKSNKPLTDGTNLKKALELVFAKHFDPEKLNIYIIATDGEPNVDTHMAIQTLIHQKCSQLDPTAQRLRLLFIRFGDEPDAINFLKNMRSAEIIRQWVDCKTDDICYEMGPQNLLLNAFYHHLDEMFQE